MAISTALNTAYSGLKTHQNAIDVTSNNVSNASNPDYVRERATLTPYASINTIPGDIGLGVNVKSINRITDTYLFERYTSTSASLENLQTKENYLKEISTYFPDVQDQGLNKDLKEFFNSWQNFASNPNDGSAKVDLAQKTQKLTDTFHSLKTKLNDIQKDINDEIKANVDEINNIIKNIASLNKEIQKHEANNISHANELRDKRDALEKRLKQLINIKVFKNGVTSLDSQGASTVGYDKDYHINLGGYPLVDNGSYYELQLIDNKGNINIGIKNGDKIVDITDKVKNSSSIIGGLLEIRGNQFDENGISQDGLLGEVNQSLDSLAGGIIRSVNSIYSYSAQEEARGISTFEPISISPEMRKVPLSYLNLSHPVKNGILKLDIIDNKGNISSEISINIKTTDSIDDVLNKINEKIQDYDLKADIVNGEIKFIPADTNNDGNINPQGNILVKDDGSLLFSALNEYEYLPIKLINNQLPLPLNDGSFDVVVYNDNGDELARRTITINSQSTDPRYNTIAGILNQINTSLVDDNNDNDNTNDVDDYYKADITNGQIIFTKKTDNNTYIGLDNDTSNFGGVFGINQFFQGNNANNIQLNETLQKDPSQIHAYKAPSEGNNDVANAILQLQFEDITFFKNDTTTTTTIFDYYKITTTNLANEVQNTTLKKEATQTLFKNISDEYYALSGVNVDEELINLEKYQRGYQANAKVVTTINKMLDALFNMS